MLGTVSVGEGKGKGLGCSGVEARIVSGSWRETFQFSRFIIVNPYHFEN